MSAFAETLGGVIQASTGDFTPALDAVLKEFDCAVGTIHRLDGEKQILNIVAQRGMPPVIMEKVSVIPVGKGMAGLAAERRAPVQVCNLQTDESGQAKPGAKLTQMEGSIALPIIVDGVLVGALGVAKPIAYEFGEEETARLMEAGAIIGRFL